MSSVSLTTRGLDNVSDELFNLPATKERSRCRHGRLYLYTSWTKTNPGRRFWRCCKSKTPDDCGAFRWYDEEVPFENMIKFGVLLDKVKGLTEQLEGCENTISELNITIQKLEENRDKATVAFTEIIDENDCLRKENAELKSQAEGSQSCSRS
ncbi:uncharacterized protein LOC126685741 isoform X2 [Mercurialis annua]|uniref:uncharacterized protein LOC126654594 n=1 Tax=Mercurialis annua TaxID=3986 RepID=UPI0021602FFB|nr:uncharacterized protein LOC126654594 [Mercurialis annua]XP_050220722.1 uncharacterized protein LOC126671066 isoform X2 [Mercurialis annua]XP_050235642.1 uncharacterized protein LOC126685741 isoform X2 [Mercurialis annua]